MDKLLKDFGEKAWRHFVDVAAKFIDMGLMRVDGGRCYVLTRDGVMLSDSVMRDLMWDE